MASPSTVVRMTYALLDEDLVASATEIQLVLEFAPET
jgi:hypothetical protein